MSNESKMEKAIKDSSPNAWLPKDGDFVEGKIQHIQMAGKLKSKGGLGVYPLLDFLVYSGTKDGVSLAPKSEIAIHGFHGTLSKGLMDLKIQPGEEIRISYHGKVEEKGAYGNGYHIYKVRPLNVRAFDWNNMPDESDPVPDELG